ncbi:MAG: hypothetical protein ACREDL_25070 [Bradyrhizobium sp.]
MRAFFFLLALLFLASPAMAKPGDRVPNFNIQRNCGLEAEGATNMQATKKSCVQDEAQAKKQLDQKWAKLVDKAKRECVGESRIGDQSYVELLTCLQMTSDWNQHSTVGQASAKRRR